MKQIEKERKWLLKNFPNNIDPYDYIFIEQIYFNNFRFRKSSYKTGRIEYEKIIKKTLNTGVNEEEHFSCTAEEFINIKGPKILKKRYCLKLKDSLVAEIDVFVNLHLIVMEVENIEIFDDIKFPDFIKECIIMEVTAFSQFSNKNLATL